MELTTNKRFYGWTALTGSALTGMVASAAFYFSYGVFLPVMCQEFGWSRGVVAAGLSVGTLCLGLPSPLIGLLVARLGPRKMLFFGNLLFAVCLAGMSQVHEVWQVFVLYGIGGFGAGCGGMVPSNTIANSWFNKKRAFAMGISSGLMGLGGFIIPPLISVFITSFGWRMSWLAEAGIVFTCSCIIGPLIMVRNKPEDVGQLPDGVPVELAAANRASVNQSIIDRDSEGWTVKRVMQQPATWLIIAFMVSTALVIGIMNSHQVAHIRDLGFSPLVAATTVSVLSIAGIVGNLGFGGLVARFGIRKLVSVAFVVRLIALVILLITSNLPMLFIYAVLFGISGAMIQTAAITMVGTYYGRAHFPQVIGTIAAFMYIFLAAGPALGGTIYDTTGTYTLAFIIMIIFTAGGLLCAFFARPPQPKNAQAVSA
jgi:MFS family permease